MRVLDYATCVSIDPWYRDHAWGWHHRHGVMRGLRRRVDVLLAEERRAIVTPSLFVWTRLRRIILIAVRQVVLVRREGGAAPVQKPGISSETTARASVCSAPRALKRG